MREVGKVVKADGGFAAEEMEHLVEKLKGLACMEVGEVGGIAGLEWLSSPWAECGGGRPKS